MHAWCADISHISIQPYNESNEHFRDVCVAAKKELARFGDRVSQVGAFNPQLSNVGRFIVIN